MRDHPAVSRRRSPTLRRLAIALLVGAIMLCGLGIHLISEDYDGFVSWFNPLAATACCAAIVMTLIALLMTIRQDKLAPPDAR